MCVWVTVCGTRSLWATKLALPYSAKLWHWKSLTNFDKRRVIRQSFLSNLFLLIAFPWRLQSIRLCSSKFLTCSIHQISSDFSTVKILRYTVLAGCHHNPNSSLSTSHIRKVKSCYLKPYMEHVWQQNNNCREFPWVVVYNWGFRINYRWLFFLRA